MDWNSILTNVVNVCVSIAWKLVLAALVFFVGKVLIKIILKFKTLILKHY